MSVTVSLPQLPQRYERHIIVPKAAVTTAPRRRQILPSARARMAIALPSNHWL